MAVSRSMRKVSSRPDGTCSRKILPLPDGRSTAHRICSKPHFQACLPSVTFGAATSNAWHRQSVKDRSRFRLSIALLPSSSEGKNVEQAKRSLNFPLYRTGSLVKRIPVRECLSGRFSFFAHSTSHLWLSLV